MVVRKNFNSLSDDEKGEFIDALLEIKRNGVYDQFVQTHIDAMQHSTPDALGMDIRGSQRNSAHRGPAFLPWHREYLRRLELALQRVNERVSLPYWDWTEDADNPTASSLWSDDFMGGQGTEESQWRVTDGPFAFDRGNWPLNVQVDLGGPALRRRFGVIESPRPEGQTRRSEADLPNCSDIELMMTERSYDVHPYNSSPFNFGFRNRLEGWIQQVGDPRVRTGGTQLHNRVHVWVGGGWIEGSADQRRSVFGTMLLPSSPNDPVFYMHHCFVDKLWADWTRMMKRIFKDYDENVLGRPSYPRFLYAPIDDGPEGHNLNDAMFPWGRPVTPAAMLDHKKLGYQYDTDDGPLPCQQEQQVEEAKALISNMPKSGFAKPMFFHFE